MPIKELTTSKVLSTVIKKSNKKAKGKKKGGQAGNSFEGVVHALEHLGFSSYTYDEFSEEGELPDRYIVCNVPYDNILTQMADYTGQNKRSGQPKTEFLIVAKDAHSTKEFPCAGNLRIRIECKFQGTPGTAQDKLLFSMANLQFGAPEKNVIMLIDGTGFTPMMTHFIAEVCKDGIAFQGELGKIFPYQKKNMMAMDIEKFIEWANRAFGDAVWKNN